jgi:peroxiredoxin Q/BCP
MAQLRQDYPRFIDQGAEILVIGPEDRPAFEAYWEQESLPFVGLPDPQHVILKRFGQQVDLFKFGRMPAQVIVDRRGMARFVHYGHSMSDIPSNEEILAALADLNAEPVIS